MQPSQSVILVLKSTKAFISFLKSQLPSHVDLPELAVIQSDCTAYVLRNQPSDEEMFDEIEKEFPRMFRHEICRWLGDDARNEIEGSFLDFLCCFKFEMHSHMIVLEPNLADGNQLLRIKPRSVLLKWMKSTAENDFDSINVTERVQLSELAENASVVVKNFDELSEVKNFMCDYYEPIFEAEMNRMGHRKSQWPEMDSYETFSRYFAVQIHSQLIHLSH